MTLSRGPSSGSGDEASQVPTPPATERSEAVILDWDGSGDPDGRGGAAIGSRIERLCAAGLHVFVVSGRGVGDVDGQLAVRSGGPGRLHLALDHGSEVFEVTERGPERVWTRVVSDADVRALDRAADLLVARLGRGGLPARIESAGLSRRRIVLDPGRAREDLATPGVAQSVDPVTGAVGGVRLAGLAQVVAVAVAASRDIGLADLRITSDVKHVEVGLTDKSDSARWAASLAGRARHHRPPDPDRRRRVRARRRRPRERLAHAGPRARLGPSVVSVGVEPGGTPTAGRPPRRRARPASWRCSTRSSASGRSAECRGSTPTRPGSSALPDEPAKERAAEALGASSNGWVGTRGAREEDGPGRTPAFVGERRLHAADDPRLLAGPRWTGSTWRRPRHRQAHRPLDLRTGVLVRSERGRLAGCARCDSCPPPSRTRWPLRAEAPRRRGWHARPLTDPGDGTRFERRDNGEVQLARTSNGQGAASPWPRTGLRRTRGGRG